MPSNKISPLSSDPEKPTVLAGFFADIQSALAKNVSIVPLVGARFSIPAGVPSESDLQRYLRCSVFFAVIGRPGGDTNGSPHWHRWNPRTERWPSLASTQSVSIEYERMLRELFEDANNANRHLYQEAFGAIVDWRTSLAFLARLIVNESGAGDEANLLCLGTPSRDVVDTFWNSILRNIQPALNHTMLAFLCDPLRIGTILTTNYDSLLEQAFSSMGRPLDVFNVELGRPLPSWHAISVERSILKIHRHHSFTRADYSLDESPTTGDLDNFASYFLRHDAGRQMELSKKPAAAQLLILGVTAQDEIVWKYLKHAFLSVFDFAAHWICNTESEAVAIDQKARKLLAPSFLQSSFQVIVQDNLGTFLFKLYQHLNGNTDGGEIETNIVKEAKQYDVALSFAGEDRAIAKELADKLIEHGKTVFYDMYEAPIFGAKTYINISQIYMLNEHAFVSFWCQRRTRVKLGRGMNCEALNPARSMMRWSTFSRCDSMTPRFPVCWKQLGISVSAPSEWMT